LFLVSSGRELKDRFVHRNYDFSYREKWYFGLTGPESRWQVE